MLRRLFWVIYAIWALLVLYNEAVRPNGPNLSTMGAMLVPPPVFYRLAIFIVRGH